MEKNGKIFVAPPDDGSDFKELFKQMVTAGAGRPLADDGFPQGPWTPELLADAISSIDVNRVGVDLRTVQLWFQENDKGISPANIRWLARIFGCDDRKATNDWLKELTVAQGRLAAKRRDQKTSSEAVEKRIDDLPEPDPANLHNSQKPVLSLEPQVTSKSRQSSLVTKTEKIFSHASYLNLPASIFAGASALGFMSYILGIHSITYSRGDGIAKQVGFLWAPNWTVMFMVLLPLFFLIVIELVAFWKHEGRPTFETEADRQQKAYGWTQNLQANSHSFWAVFVVCILFAGLIQWVGVQLMPLLEQRQDFAPSWGTIGIIRPNVISTPAAIMFTALAYLYMSVSFYLLFAGLILLHMIVHDLWMLKSRPDWQTVQKPFPKISETSLRILRGVFRCTVLVVLSAICMKVQSAYLASQGSDIVTWMMRDALAVFTDYDDGDRSSQYRLPTHYSSLLVTLSGCSVFLYAAVRLGDVRRLRRPLLRMCAVIGALFATYLLIDVFDGFSLMLVTTGLIAIYGLFDPEFKPGWQGIEMERDSHVS
ncbi:hypothetical protein [Rhizobium sp. FKY42]|uniref:RcgA family putative transporter n=1 Tax=Rhizobium sp. FKY42 TaxID=2562310 RepID=UPI0010BF8264|nr:hypothetical protein [Rhizobium sp. FKY42]